MDKWKNKTFHTQRQTERSREREREKYYLAFKKKELLPLVTWMNLKDYYSEVSQTQKDVYQMISLLFGT